MTQSTSNEISQDTKKSEILTEDKSIEAVDIEDKISKDIRIKELCAKRKKCEKNEQLPDLKDKETFENMESVNKITKSQVTMQMDNEQDHKAFGDMKVPEKELCSNKKIDNDEDDKVKQTYDDNNKIQIKKINQSVQERANELIKIYTEKTNISINNTSIDDDFSKIVNRCCENIIGYVKVPLGISPNPIIINSKEFFVPIATTEGALVASLCRGVKLINACGGVNGIVENLGITRSFAIKFETAKEASECYIWIRKENNIEMLKKAGNATSNYLKVKSIESKHLIGRTLYVKVQAYTGDAMGMNMITKACNAISTMICSIFVNSKLITISANTCVDKKHSAENYCNGRGRKVSISVEIPNDKCREILKVNIHDLLQLHHTKIFLGSALTMSGFNCQAANYVTAIYIACGQDVAHVIESSNCLIDMEIKDDKLIVSLFMPSIVCGVLGGGTHLEPQANFLEQFKQEDNAYFITERNLDKAVAPNWFALMVASAVLSGELSCLASLTDNTLMKAHLKLNRK